MCKRLFILALTLQLSIGFFPLASLAQTTSSDQLSLSQMASLISSLQTILNSLKAKVASLKGTSSVVSTAQAQTADITTGLVGHWKFDEASGTSASDSSGNNNTGTLTNGPTWVLGKIGNAINLDGTNDYVSVPHAANIDFVQNITLSGWINKASNSGIDTILRKNTSGGHRYFFRTNSTSLYYTAGSGGWDHHFYAANFQTNQWYHVAVLYDASAQVMRMYIDGSEVKNAFENAANFTHASAPLFIGSEGGTTNYFHGLLDDLRIYNRVLTPSDISALYSLGSGGTPPPPPTGDTQAPTVPSGLTATAVSSSQINLSWTASTDNTAVTGYRIYRNGSQITTVTNTSYSDTGLSPSTSYSYTVAAYDAANNLSNQSSEATATTQSPPPPPTGGIPSALGWYQIPNTVLRTVCPPPTSYQNIQGVEGCDAVTADWAGGAFDTTQNRLLITGGGHAGYAGNEIYAVDLGTLTAQRLNNPTATVRDGCANGGTYSDGLPVARHSYNHLAYLPNQNSLFMWGGSQWQCGSMAGDTWLFNLNTLTWTKKSSTGGPTADFGRSMAYDSNNALVYARDDFNLRSYNPATDTWATRSSSSGMSDYKTAVIDSVRKKYFLQINGDSHLYWYDITNSSGTSVLQSGQTSGCGGFIGNYTAGMEYDAAQNRIVGWNGGNVVYTLNPDTLSCTTVSYSGGPTAMSNGTFGRFRYVPAMNVFVVCNDVDINCYSLRLTSGTTPPADTTLPTAPSNLSASAVSSSQINLSWSASTDNVGVTGYRVERCTGSSCTTFAQIGTPPPAGGTNSYSDTGLSANTTYRYQVRAGDAAGNLSGYSSIASATTQSSSGGGSADADFQTRCGAAGVLKCAGFDTASAVAPATWPAPGNYPVRAGQSTESPVFDSTTKASGEGSLKFIVPGGSTANSGGQWRQDFGRDFGPGQSFYVQFRQRFSPEMLTASFGGGGWKQVIFHDFEASCANVEITTNNGYYRGFPQMYTNCGQGLLEYPAGSSDYILEYSQPYPPGSSGVVGMDYYCQYSLLGGNPANNRCAWYQANNWMTFYYEVTIGSWGQPNSIIRGYVGYEGQPLKVFINQTNHAIYQDNSSYFFDYLTLLPYDTGKNGQQHPTANTWYDELIVSTQPIAAPGGATPPATLVGDLNSDRIVNSLDWSLMNAAWSTNNATADLTHDSIVNSLDFSMMNANWGRTS